MTKPMIYLDHAASAPLLPEARAAIIEALDLVGNPSSVHRPGRELRALVERARDAVARLAGAARRDVVFTSSATEAITQAIVGGVRRFGLDEVLLSTGEHMSVVRAAEASGVPLGWVDLDPTGTIDLASLKRHLDRLEQAGRRCIVAVHAINNETGVSQPLARIEALVAATPHLLFVDAAQAAGKVELAFSARSADMVAMSAHKIGGPAGVGALLVKPRCDEVRLVPGGGQEQGRRGGTEPAALIAGFGAAAEAFPQRFDAGAVALLGAQVQKALLELRPDTVVFGEGAERLGHVVSFAMPGLGNAVAMMGLDLEGVAVSSGSACSSGKVGRSHVLSAMGVPAELADCALRISLGWSSTPADAAGLVSALERVLLRHRSSRGRAA